MNKTKDIINSIDSRINKFYREANLLSRIAGEVVSFKDNLYQVKILGSDTIYNFPARSYISAIEGDFVFIEFKIGDLTSGIIVDVLKNNSARARENNLFYITKELQKKCQILQEQIGSLEDYCVYLDNTMWKLHHLNLYHRGEVITLNKLVVNGYITTGSQEILFMLPLNKKLYSGCSISIDMAYSEITIRGISGYVRVANMDPKISTISFAEVNTISEISSSSEDVEEHQIRLKLQPKGFKTGERFLTANQSTYPNNTPITGALKIKITFN